MMKQSCEAIRHLYCIRMRLPFLFAVGAALVAQTPPQTKPPDELPSITVDVDVVSILASVRDKRGALVPNLQKDDFTILEEGKAQSIKYFTKETDQIGRASCRERV